MLHSVSPRRTTTSSSTTWPAAGVRLSRSSPSGSCMRVRSGGEGVQAASGAVAPGPGTGGRTLGGDAGPARRCREAGVGGRRPGRSARAPSATERASRRTARRRWSPVTGPAGAGHGRARGGGRRRSGHRGAGRQGRAQAGAQEGRRQPPHRGGRERRGASGGHGAGGSRQGGEQREREREGEPRDEQVPAAATHSEQGVSRPGRAGGLHRRPRVPQGRAEQGDRAAADEQEPQAEGEEPSAGGRRSGGVVPGSWSTPFEGV